MGYNLDTGKTIKSAENLVMWHANDMTYNPDEECLMICHCSERDYDQYHYNELSVVSLKNLDTLENLTIDETIILPEPCTDRKGPAGIEYNANRKQYVINTNGERQIWILDEDFNFVKKFNTSSNLVGIATATAPQGTYCDDNFIYCLYYDSANKLSTNTTVTQVHGISVFDWDGNRVKEIQFSVYPSDLPEDELDRIKPGTMVLKNEPETITFINGKFYIGVNVGETVNSDNGYQAQLLCTLEIVTN